MNVRAVYRVERAGYDIYVEMSQEEDGSRWFSTGEQLVKVRPGAEAPRYMFVEEQIADALAEALRPRPVASERHLSDAIAIRDRLLSLVENNNAVWRPNP